MKAKGRLFIIAGVLTLLLLATLSSGIVSAEIINDDEVQESSLKSSIHITDARGEKITFQEPPQKIISFMPSNTEILFHLEVGDRVIATDDMSDYPPSVEELPKIGDSFNVDYEKIVNLEPDVVVTPSYNTEMINKLEDYGETVVATSSTSFNDVYSDMRLLGEMCGIEEKADSLVNELKTEMESITDNTADLSAEKRVDTLYMTSTEPIYTPGNGTFMNTLIENAGGNNIASDKMGWKTISEETIVGSDPEIIIAPNRIEKDVNNLIEQNVWKEISAVENDRVFFVDDNIMSRPGPRVVKAQNRLTNITKEVLDIENPENNKTEESNQTENTPGFGTAAVLTAGSLSAAIYKKKKKVK